MSWSTSELRVRLAPLNRFKPSSKIFYWPFQGGTSFGDLFCFCSVLCLRCLCARLFICALWSPAGKGLTSWLSIVVSTVSLSLSHWYPGSGVVLDCIDSWSLHPYLLWCPQYRILGFKNIWNYDDLFCILTRLPTQFNWVEIVCMFSILKYFLKILDFYKTPNTSMIGGCICYTDQNKNYKSMSFLASSQGRKP